MYKQINKLARSVLAVSPAQVLFHYISGSQVYQSVKNCLQKKLVVEIKNIYFWSLGEIKNRACEAMWSYEMCMLVEYEI